jgi:hypothetical protein
LGGLLICAPKIASGTPIAFGISAKNSVSFNILAVPEQGRGRHHFDHLNV